MPFLRSRPDILAGFRRGDRAALEAVYWAYVERVERTVRVVCWATGTRSEIADVVQETFLRAFEERARQAYDPSRDYGPYLVTIARNLVTDRARARGRELPLDDPAEPASDPPAQQDPDAPPWADEATMRCVEAYLAGLDPELAALHEARYVRGLSQVQAADALGCTRQQLRTREARLREGLVRALREAKITVEAFSATSRRPSP